MTVAEKIAETGTHPFDWALPMMTNWRYLPSGMKERMDRQDYFDRHESDTIRAEEVLGNGGFSSFDGYKQICRENNILLPENELEQIFDQFMALHQDSMFGPIDSEYAQLM